MESAGIHWRRKEKGNIPCFENERYEILYRQRLISAAEKKKQICHAFRDSCYSLHFFKSTEKDRFDQKQSISKVKKNNKIL